METIDKIDLSIIIVNYKTPYSLLNCLKSIYSFEPVISKEVIVVDNASEDSSKALVNSAFPSVKWIQMDYNSGFVRANNVAIRQSQGNTVLLLNSDTLVEGDAIQRAYLKLTDSEYVACGVQLLNSDRTPQISGNYFMKGSLNNLLPLPVVGGLVKLMGTLFKVKKPNVPDAKEAVEVDWINGAFLMVKKVAILWVGLMDEDFFLYAEEAEWCSRLRKRGKLCIFGQYNVIHHQGASTKSKGYNNLFNRNGFQYMLSNFVRIRKQYGVKWYLFHMFAYLLTVPIMAVLGFRHPLDVVGFAKNVLGLFWYLPRVIANKPYFYKVL